MASDRDKEKIHMWVEPDTKTEWQEYADESMEVESLTQLIRNAVNVYMANGGQLGSGANESQQQQVSLDNTEVVEGINRIESQLEDLDDRVLSLSNMAEQSPELRDVMMKVFEVLPPAEPQSDEHHYEKEYLNPDEQDSIAWDGRPSTIADMIEVEEFWIDMALEKLDSDSNRLKTTRDESDQPRYWKDLGYQEQRYAQFRDSDGGSGTE